MQGNYAYGARVRVSPYQAFRSSPLSVATGKVLDLDCQVYSIRLDNGEYIAAFVGELSPEEGNHVG